MVTLKKLQHYPLVFEKVTNVINITLYSLHLSSLAHLFFVVDKVCVRLFPFHFLPLYPNISSKNLSTSLQYRQVCHAYAIFTSFFNCISWPFLNLRVLVRLFYPQSNWTSLLYKPFQSINALPGLLTRKRIT